jgi:hypothetical protein
LDSTDFRGSWKILGCLNATSWIIETKSGPGLVWPWHRVWLWLTPALRQSHASPESDFLSFIQLVFLEWICLLQYEIKKSWN